MYFIAKNYCAFSILYPQQRNKPKEAPKAPEQAPFFLPTLPGVDTRFAPEVKEPQKETKSTRRLEKAKMGVESIFAQKLAAEESTGDCELVHGLIQYYL